MRNRRLNGIDSLFVKLLVPLAQTSGKYVVLPTVQLFRVTLIPRLLLLLLLITLAGLLIITTLVTRMALAMKTASA